MRYPTISVVTPSFNQGPYIEQTIRSVILQRYPKLEYVMMDGGSNDETTSIIDRYSPFFKHAQSAPDGGQADAIRRGFEHTTGDIMCYLNSDDLLAPDALFVVADFFDKHPDVDVVYSHRCAIWSDNTVIWYWRLPAHNDFLMKRWDLIPQETAFWRRSIYEKVGGIDSTFRFAMDYDLFVKFMKNGRMRRNDRFHGAFRQHPASKTSQLLETVGQEEIKRVWKDHDIKSTPFDKWIGHIFFRAVTVPSGVFAEKGEVTPGILPGIGWNYDRLWGNQLGRSEIPGSAQLALR